MKRSSARSFGLVAALMAGLAGTGSAMAQNAPLWLLPGNDPAPTSSQPAAPPPPSSPAPAMPQTPPPSSSREVTRSGIQSETLRPPSADASGVLSSAQGGFSKSLWQGTSAALVRRLIPELPGPLVEKASRTARDMQRRLLLSSAEPPAGSVAGLTPSLATLRAERLWAMGDALSTVRLVDSIAGSSNEPRLNRLGLEGALLTDNLAAACDRVNRSIGDDPRQLVAKTNVLCKFRFGQIAEGNLALDLLREAKAVDPAFVAAAEVISGLPPVPANKIKITTLEPEHVAAFNTAGLSLPDGVLNKITPMMAQAVALGSSNDPALRVQAAEIAEAAGVLPLETLKDIYRTIAFSANDLAEAMNRTRTPTGRALIWRAVQETPDEAMKAQLALRAIQSAAANGQGAAAMRLFARDLSTVRATPSLSGDAATIALTLLSNGYFEQSRPWMELLRSSGNTGDARRLWPLYAVYATKPGEPIPENQIAEWRANLVREKPDATARRTAVVLGVLTGLGGKMPETVWLDAVEAPASSVPAALLTLTQTAALEGRVGGVVLPLLVMMGNTPLDKISPVVLSEAISTLSVVGQNTDAQNLAVEAILANGL